MRFSSGDEVEVSGWDDGGLRGAWYEAKVVRAMSRTRRYSVVYDHLLAGDGYNPRPLREIADCVRVRPRPPRRGGPFATHQPVDAWHKDGWWTGLVVGPAAAPIGGNGEEGERYMVCFPKPREQTEFAATDLRAHLEWVDDVWVRPDENSPGQEALAFPVGTQVEVISRNKDSHSMWFIGTVEKLIWENSLLVQYKNMRADVGGQLLGEIVDVQHVRPCPPPILDIRMLNILEEVEVFRDDSWCAGVITRIHTGSNYSVKSEHWEGEMVFCQSELRLQHGWTDGCRVQASKAKYIKSPNLHQAKSVRHCQSHTRNGDGKSHGSDYISISSGSREQATSSDTEMDNGSTFEDQIGFALSYKNPMDAVGDGALLLDSLIMARTAKSAVQVENEFAVATPALRDTGKSHIICALPVQQSCFKKHSEGIISKSLNSDSMMPANTLLEKVNVEPPHSAYFQDQLVRQSSVDIYELSVGSGENSILHGEKFEHHSREQNYHSSVNCENKDVRHDLKWAHKHARSPRMNSLSQKRKAVTPKNGWKIRQNVVEMGQHTKDKRRWKGELLDDPLDICRDNMQLAEEHGEPSQGSLLLLQLDPVVEADLSCEELTGQELLDMTMSPDIRLNEIPENDIQTNEAARVKKIEAVNTPLGDCESHRVVSEEGEVTTDAIPCGSPLKFNLPFVKSSSMWEAIEAMEVFRAIPQLPHFRPLLQYCSELREGMAIGLMVTFDNLVANMKRWQITHSENIFEEGLKMVSHLEAHGFDVQHVKDCLKKLLRIKRNLKQHEDKGTALQCVILNRQKDGQKLTDEIEMIDRSLKELEEAMTKLCDMRSALVMHRETIDYEIAKLQIDEKAAAQAPLSASEEFDRTVAAAW